MQTLINLNQLKKFRTTYDVGDTLFLEGDRTKDLFILVSGQLDILKGPKKIADMHETGSLFGEMSFLLGEKRTATIKASSTVEAIRIPAEEIPDIVKELPSFGIELSKVLAQRLQSTTTMAYGLKEFCDSLPDAVMITTDQDQKVLAWNSAAERLYGRSGEEMRNLPLKEIYADEEAYSSLQEDLEQGKSSGSKDLEINVPHADHRFVSTSTTVLYDGHYNVQGLLFLARDVTKIHELEKRYKKIRNWLIPAILLIGMLVAGIFWVLPEFTKGTQILDYKKQTFKDHFEYDSSELGKMLRTPILQHNIEGINQILKEYFATHDYQLYGIQGLLLLDQDKTVIEAYSPNSTDMAKQIIGSSYGGLPFNEEQNGLVSILGLFRATNEHPMGKEFHELAWKLRNHGNKGWLIYQLDMEWLGKEYGIDVKTLKSLRFKETDEK